MLIAALALQATPAEPETITVTGRRKIDSEYQACRAGGCSPTRDANATLAYAEQQLLAGDYRGSRAALRGAIRRQGHAAKTHPGAVSALYDADSTVAFHLGDEHEARRSGLRSIGILDDAYGPADPRAISAVAQIGSVEEKRGNMAEADQAYRSAEKRARAAGLTLLADVVDLRRAWLLSSRSQDRAAQGRLTRIADNAAGDPRVRLQAAILAARVARGRGDEAHAERMIAMVGTQPRGARPVLLWSPPIPMTSAQAVAAAAKYGMPVPALQAASSAKIPVRWVDVGFWVRPSGKVEDAEVLRGSKARDWAKAVMNSIEARRYAAMDAPAGDPGHYRIERFTLTAEMITPINSRIERRAGPLKLRWLDITDDPARKAATS